MADVLTVIFNVESEAYQAFSELKAFKQDQKTQIAQIALVKNENGKITIKDSVDFDEVPNLYLGSNGDPLYPHCKLNDNKKFEIKCTFSKDEIKNNYFKYNGSETSLK